MNRNSQASVRRPKVCRAWFLRLVGLVALSFCGACSRHDAARPAGSLVTTARYVHHETTGVTDELIMPDGKRQMIQFAPESRQEELRALQAVLSCGIFGSIPGAASEIEQPLTVQGELHSEVLRTPAGPDRAAPEEYRQFTLQRWSLAAPFVARAGFDGLQVTALPGQTSLRQVCPAITGHGDLDRFVRIR